MEPAAATVQATGSARRFRDRECVGCGVTFTPTGPRNSYHSADCRKAHAAEVGKAMARGADRIGDSAGARERKRAGVKQIETEQARAEDAQKAIGDLAAQAVERAADHGVVGEQQMLQRIRAFSAAKRAQDWPAIEHALIDIAACALSWASRIDHVQGESPLPAVLPVEPTAEGHDAPLNGSTKSVADRYADILLDAAGHDLDGETARATVERLLGVGL